MWGGISEQGIDFGCTLCNFSQERVWRGCRRGWRSSDCLGVGDTVFLCDLRTGVLHATAENATWVIYGQRPNMNFPFSKLIAKGLCNILNTLRTFKQLAGIKIMEVVGKFILLMSKLLHIMPSTDAWSQSPGRQGHTFSSSETVAHGC